MRKGLGAILICTAMSCVPASILCVDATSAQSATAKMSVANNYILAGPSLLLFIQLRVVGTHVSGSWTQVEGPLISGGRAHTWLYAMNGTRQNTRLSINLNALTKGAPSGGRVNVVMVGQTTLRVSPRQVALAGSEALFRQIEGVVLPLWSVDSTCVLRKLAC
jgi:hypothetical protein